MPHENALGTTVVCALERGRLTMLMVTAMPDGESRVNG